MSAHLPASLQGGQRVHGEAEAGDEQLAQDEVHQQRRELGPQLHTAGGVRRRRKFELLDL